MDASNHRVLPSGLNAACLAVASARITSSPTSHSSAPNPLLTLQLLVWHHCDPDQAPMRLNHGLKRCSSSTGGANRGVPLETTPLLQERGPGTTQSVYSFVYSTDIGRYHKPNTTPLYHVADMKGCNCAHTAFNRVETVFVYWDRQSLYHIYENLLPGLSCLFCGSLPYWATAHSHSSICVHLPCHILAIDDAVCISQKDLEKLNIKKERTSEMNARGAK